MVFQYKCTLWNVSQNKPLFHEKFVFPYSKTLKTHSSSFLFTSHHCTAQYEAELLVSYLWYTWSKLLSPPSHLLSPAFGISILFSAIIDQLISPQISHVDKILWCLSFYAWFISLDTVTSSSIHRVVNLRISLIFVIKFFIEDICHIYFVY